MYKTEFSAIVMYIPWAKILVTVHSCLLSVMEFHARLFAYWIVLHGCE